jgi:ferredoxin
MAGLPLVVFSTEDFTGSGNCAACHVDLEDQIGNYVSISNHWRSTMMANAAKDPFWQAKVASEVERNPHLKEVIEEKCASCHMPMAYTQAEVRDVSAMIFDSGLTNPSNPLNPAAMDGVSCTLCHQIVDPVLGEYTVDTSTEPPDRLIYGPYENPEQSLMIAASKFTPVYGEHVTDSVLCGTCH